MRFHKRTRKAPSGKPTHTCFSAIAAAWLAAAPLLATTASASADSGPQVLTAKDLVRVKSVSDPRVSPDGKWVAFTVSTQDIETNSGDSHIYVVSTSGGKVRKITGGDGSERYPRWSPDGKSLAFVSTRHEGRSQLYVLPFRRGGEAKRITNVLTGASSPVWSPDGKKLVYVSRVYPKCRTQECNRKEFLARKNSQVKAEIYDSLLYRHWNHWRHGRVKHLLEVPASGGESRDITPGPHDVPPIALGSSQDFAFSPDGEKLCFVKNTDKLVAASTNNDLFVMPAAGGNPKKITPNRANDTMPVYSPNGRYLAYRAMKRPGYESDRRRIVILDLETNRRRVITEKFDRSVSEMVWSRDSSKIYFTAADRGYVPIFSVPASGGTVETVLDEVMVRSLSLTPDGRSLVFTSQSNDAPAEVFRYELATKELDQLTKLNAELMKSRKLGKMKSFWFKGAGDERVHAFLLMPPKPTQPEDENKKIPLVMLIHGGPQGMFGDSFHPRWNSQLFAAPGYAVLMINFHGSVGYGQAFTDSIRGDWGGKPYVDIMRGLRAALKKFPRLDERRVGAAGASYGGYMINWIGTHTDRYRCLISHAGVYDLTSMYGATEELWFPEWEYRGPPWGPTKKSQYQRFSPSNYVQAWKTPTLVIHGQHDYRVPVTQGMQLFTALQRRKVPSRFLYFPDENHFIQKPKNRLLWWKTVHGWFSRYLKR
jgi:dipeptidyl aminopeptidase/acylaminoacyl peptidase